MGAPPAVLYWQKRAAWGGGADVIDFVVVRAHLIIAQTKSLIQLGRKICMWQDYRFFLAPTALGYATATLILVRRVLHRKPDESVLMVENNCLSRLIQAMR